MKTDALIAALTIDNGARRSLSRVLTFAVLAGTLLSGLVFFATLGVRQDLGPALATWRFDVKLAIIALALAIALVDTLRLMRPTGRQLPLVVNLLPVAALLAAVLAELYLVPAHEWPSKLIGSNAMLCLVAIPALSLAPLVALLLALRHGAPSSRVSLGACAGRLAAAIAALLYGLHCFDDSPLFVATWYTLAALPVIAVASLAGRFTLRW